MSAVIFSCMGLGIGAGLLLGLAATKKLAAHYANVSKTGVVIGGALAVLPAIFLSIVIGGTGGGGFGEAIAGQAGMAFGLAAGIATVLGTGISFGAITGIVVGWFFVRTSRAVK